MTQFVDYANLAQFYAGLKERFAPKGHGGTGGGEYTDVTQLPGESWEKLFAAMDSGERCSGYGKTLAIGYEGSDRDQLRAKFYKHKITADRVYLRDVTIKPSGIYPLFLELHCDKENSEILFENVTFQNILIAPYAYVYQSNLKTLAFKNCRFLNNEYSALRVSKGGTHILFEDCVFDHFYPDFQEYREDQIPRTKVGWVHQPIVIRSSSIQLTVKRTVFRDIMANGVVLFQGDCCNDKTANGLYATFEDCVFEDTNAHCIVSSRRAWSGYVRGCRFERIGSLRCNEAGYNLPTDSPIVSGSGTADDPYIYKCGVGGNAIFSGDGYTYRNDVVIENCIFRHLIENGIEGAYDVVRNNLIEDTGYRLDEGIYNPSTESMYGNSRVIENNIFRNPSPGHAGLVLTERKWCDDEPVTIRGNVFEYLRGGLNDYAAIRIRADVDSDPASMKQPILISGNTYRGFQAHYWLFNGHSFYNDNIRIFDEDSLEDGTEIPARLVYATTKDEWKGAVLTGPHKSGDMLQNGKFADWTAGMPDHWGLLYGAPALYVENGRRFLRVTSTSQSYCAALSQEFTLPNCTCMCLVELTVRSSIGKVGVAIKSKTDAGATAGHIKAVLTGTPYDTIECGVEEFTTIRTTRVAAMNARLSILSPLSLTAEADAAAGTADVYATLDIRDIKLTYIPNDWIYPETAATPEALTPTEDGVYPALDPFAGDTPKFPLANAVKVEWYLPGSSKANIGLWGTGVWWMQQNTGDAKGEGRMVIRQDMKLTERMFISRCRCEVDLQGYAITSSNENARTCLTVQGGGKIRLTDSSDAKTGRIHSDLGFGLWTSAGSNVTIEAGTYTGSDRGLYCADASVSNPATITLKGGVFGDRIGELSGVLMGKNTTLIFDVPEGKTVTINGLTSRGAVQIAENTLVTVGTTPVTTMQQILSLSQTSETVTAQYSEGAPALAYDSDKSTVAYTWWRVTDADGSYEELEFTGPMSEIPYNIEQRKVDGYTNRIRLESDVYLYKPVNFSGLDLLIDLNGHAIETDYASYALGLTGGSARIVDGDQGGRIIGRKSQAIMTYKENLTVEAGEIISEGSYTSISAKHGSVITIKGGTVRGKVGVSLAARTTSNGAVTNAESTLRMLGGQLEGVLDYAEITGSRYGVMIGAYCEAEISGGTITGTTAGVQASGNGVIRLQAVDGELAVIEKITSSAPAVIGDNTLVTLNGAVVTSVTTTSGTVGLAYQVGLVGGSVEATGFTAPETLDLTVGSTATITVTVQPEGATVGSAITWTSDTPAVATVANGRVTAVSAGTATLTGTLASGFAASVLVTVTAQADASLNDYFLYYDFTDAGNTDSTVYDLSPNGRDATLVGFTGDTAGYTANGLRSGGVGQIRVPLAGLGANCKIHLELSQVNTFPTGAYGRLFQAGTGDADSSLRMVFRKYASSAANSGFCLQAQSGATTHDSGSALDKTNNSYMSKDYLTANPATVEVSIAGNALIAKVMFDDGNEAIFSVPEEGGSGWTTFAPTLSGTNVMILLNRYSGTHGIDVTLSKFWIKETDGTLDGTTQTLEEKLVEQTLAKKNALGLSANAFGFTVLTDLHYSEASPKASSADMAVALADGLGVNALVTMGDLENGEGVSGKATMLSNLGMLAGKLQATTTDCLSCRGNHDTNHNGIAAEDRTADCVTCEAELYTAMNGYAVIHSTGATLTRATNTDAGYYYVDYATPKVRLLFLNSYEDRYENGVRKYDYSNTGVQTQAQLSFVQSALTMPADGWKLAVFGHICPVMGEWTHDYGKNQPELHALLKGFVDGGGELIGGFFGHVHDDLRNVVDGVRYVISTSGKCSQRWDSAPPRSSTGLTQYSNNTFIYDGGVLYCLKTGSGADWTDIN